MSNKGRKKVFVGMSGGVDSSVAALLLKNEGYDVTGVFINGFNVDGCQDKDAEDARRAADHLGIPFYAIDAREEYFEHVVQYMIDGYRKGLTPNPDVMCNKEIKFGIFLDKALKLGADYIATGHYVCLSPPDVSAQSVSGATPKSYSSQKHPAAGSNTVPAVNYRLLTAKDEAKDQSYFLWTLTQEQLRCCLFPIGEYTKAEVREIARKAGLPNADKKDSQGICFLGKVKLPDFLREYVDPKKGDVVDIDGNKIGEHDGVQFYTIGQRHINVNFQFPISVPSGHLPQGDNFQINSKSQNSKHKDRLPYYVSDKDIKTNTLTVVEGDDNPALFKKEATLTGVHFITQEIHSTIRANRRMDVYVKVRYRQLPVKATLVISETQSANREEKEPALPVTDCRVRFSEPVKFVAPGQSAVFYSENADENGNREMLGGGVILG